MSQSVDKKLPRKRTDLLSQKLDDELILVDPESREPKAHCLSNVAAEIWDACDGESSLETALERWNRGAETPATLDVALLALDELRAAELVVAEPEKDCAKGREVTRRELLARAAAAGLTLPLVSTIVLPTPASAQSGNKQPATVAHVCPAQLGDCSMNATYKYTGAYCTAVGTGSALVYCYTLP